MHFQLFIVILFSSLGRYVQFWRLPDPDRRDEQVARVINRVLRAPIRGCLQEDADGRRKHCTGIAYVMNSIPVQA